MKAMFSLPSSITIREVGPRDGLQSEAPVAVLDRVRLIDALLASGLTNIEMCSFVSVSAVPSMAGAAEVVAAVGDRNGVIRAALVPNLRGAQMALAAGVDELTITVSVSEEYSMKNTNMTVARAMDGVVAIAALAQTHASSVPVDVVLSCSFGSPYEGEIAPREVARLATLARSSGATSVTLADTTGMATPRRVCEVLEVLSDEVRAGVGLHLHETRGTALVNAFAAMQLGVRRFDTSIGGLGGSPFAAGAAGNLATEDLVYLCDDLGIVTGVDLDALLGASALAAVTVGRTLPSRVASGGPRLPRPPSAEVSDAVV